MSQASVELRRRVRYVAAALSSEGRSSAMSALQSSGHPEVARRLAHLMAAEPLWETSIEATPTRGRGTAYANTVSRLSAALAASDRDADSIRPLLADLCDSHRALRAAALEALAEAQEIDA